MFTKLWKGTLSIVLAVSVCTPFTTAFAKQADTKTVGTTYYVSSLDGSDRNDGQSENEAFYSLQKINDITLQPGDRVLLEADSIFVNGYLHIKGGGSQEAPIIIDKYGEGNDPFIQTNGDGVWYQNYGKQLDNPQHKYKGYVSSSILLYDVDYIEINNLEITNVRSETDAKYNDVNAMNRTGVAAVAQNKGTLNHIYLNSLNIHDVYGNVYDKHMLNGGVYFSVFKSENESKTGISKFNDVMIENCVVDNVNRWGIAVGYTAYWDQFLAAQLSDEVMSTYASSNVTIRNNYIKEAGGDAITTMYCDRPIIEYNVSDGAARQINTTDYSATGFGRVAAAIWPWKCKDAIFQYNEAFDTYLNPDGQAWDADYGDGTIYQYNYSHNNGGGALMVCNYDAVNTIFRYNISEDDNSGVLNLPVNPNAEIYNNTFYMKSGVPFIRSGMTGGTAFIENNIIYNSGPAVSEDWTKGGTKATYNNNLYYGYTNVPTSDSNAIIADPKFENPGSGPDAYTGIHPKEGTITHSRTAFDGYRLQGDSPAINAGVYRNQNGGKDFFGNVLKGTPDIGAYESSVVSLTINSDLYSVNTESKTIKGLENDTTVKQFLANLSYEDGLTIYITNAKGVRLTADDIVHHSDQLHVEYMENGSIYTILAKDPDSDNTIKANTFMQDDETNTIYVPILTNQPILVSEFLRNIQIKETANKQVMDEEEIVDLTAPLTDGMTLQIIAENGDINTYTLEAKENYHYALDYKNNQQGNVWFAQVKSGDTYTNLTNYDATYPQWNGASYGGVGLDLPNHNTKPSDTTHGLLIDSIDPGQRQNGYSMAYRTPINGVVTLQLKDGEPYLRQASASVNNKNGDIHLTFTKNGEAISETYTFPNDGTPITGIEEMRIEVQTGDMIRAEITAEGTPTKGSAHVTPIVSYVDEAAPDTQAPSAPQNITVQDLHTTSATLQWDASNDNVGVTSYRVYHGEEQLAETTTTGVQLTNLTPNTTYNLHVYAYDAAGNRSDAGRITITTLAESQQEDTTQIKAILHTAIEKAEAIRNGASFQTLAPSVQTALIARIAQANSVYKDETASVEVCFQTWLQLADILHYTDFKADKKLLKDLITQCELIDTSLYVEGVEAFEAALSQANDVVNDQNALQTRIDHAYTTLLTAKNALKEKPTTETDKHLLEQLIQLVSKTVEQKDQYVQNSAWNTFIEALTVANNVMEQTDVDQATINQAIEMLAAAYENIRLLPDEALLTKLSAFIASVNQIQRSMYRQEDLAIIDQVFEEAEHMLSTKDFTVEQFRIFDEKMNNVLTMIDERKQTTPSIDPSTPMDTPKTDAKTTAVVKPAGVTTGDTTNVFAMTALMLLGLGGFIITRKKRHHNS